MEGGPTNFLPWTISQTTPLSLPPEQLGSQVFVTALGMLLLLLKFTFPGMLASFSSLKKYLR
jgi:hypothetical protein